MKVRFEYNIDEIVEVSQFPNTRDEIYKGEYAKGKTFLFVDKLTGNKQAAVCVEPISESMEYASLNTLYLPQNAEIISEEEKEDTKHEALMAHVQNCCDKVCKTAQHLDEHNAERYNLVMNGLKGLFDKIEEGGNGSGISEKTLLNALEIVTKNNK